MKLYEAKNIITDIFENQFNKDKFSYFIRNLLKNLHPAEFLRTGYNIPKAFENFIASYERLGKYEDEEGNLIDVMIVKLKRDHSIDYARNTQRNFVRWYLNDKGKDAALVAFHTEKSSEWRFSFIKMLYSLEKKKDELTPAKRSSFMVGEAGKSHTAQRQLVDLLKNDYAPYISDIENAFSIEAVSDEFFEKYKALLFNLVDEIETIVKKDKTVKEEFESKNISILNFSKKLLGQVVFLYFLQRKGWLGLAENEKYGDGDKHFLRSLFKNTKPDKNFFNDYLEYLFYDALSKKRVTDYYDRFGTRIPFLNGGLFDPIEFYDWQKTDIVIPNELFSNRIGEEEGIGILDVFDLYNFTVKEDEPLETEVAIDPEMLGKVFERMLDVTERKSKGAFYTPREIVHYMAQQSLLYFLETELQNKNVAKEDLETFIHHGEHIIDKDIAIEEGKLKQTANKQKIPESIRNNAKAIDLALENIKICDPAVGSGAFPVGIMNEIVKLRKLITPFLKDTKTNKRSAYQFKSNAIQNSIYGVDVDAGAVEIAKLRLWLSMVVDEQSIKTVEPLPNLDYKIVKGNSLINIPDGTAINDSLAKEIEELIKSYYHITDKDKKQEQKQIIDNKIEEQLIFVSGFAGYDIDFDFNLFFHEVWNDKKGFDVVIGNPPYVEHKKLKHIAYILKQIFDVYSGSSDLSVYFFEKGLKILHQNGNLSYISTNKFFNTGYGKFLRKYLLKYSINSIINFEQVEIFEKVLVSSTVMCLSKELMNPENQFNYVEFYKEKEWRKEFNYRIEFQSNLFRQELFDDKEWNFLNPNELRLKSSIEQNSEIIKDISGIEIKRGITTGYDPAFVLPDNIKFKTADVLKPLIKGREIKRFMPLKSNSQLLFIPWHFPLHNEKSINGASEIAEEKLKKDYPDIYSHLINHYNKLIQRNKEETGIRYEWYSLQRCAASYYQLFEYNKIVWPLTADKWGFTLDKEMHYLTSGGFFLVSKYMPLKFILAVLNSKLMEYYFKFIGVMTAGGAYTLKKATIEKLPIINSSNTKEIELIVDYILFLKSRSTEKTSFYFEQLIDGVVYELYLENEIKHAGCDILQYLNNLPEIKEEMDDEEKMNIITKVFNKLYDKESPVRKNLFFMDSVEEVAIIKESLEK
jgi:Eco57I restriction-modification methylase/TaqI-like C-terminal specificity domain